MEAQRSASGSRPRMMSGRPRRWYSRR
jgi:hypothetical protein